MPTITLVVIPGPGARSVTIQDNTTTISDLVTSESLINRDIIVNGESIPRNMWSSHILNFNDEVFATASVKGNVKNGPSQTGRPSGGGRGNNPPRGK